MSDMTRAEVIKILSECKEKGFKHTFYTLDEYHTAMDIAINSLQIDEQYDLMYEQAEPKMGHWVDYQDGRWIYAKCDKCGAVHYVKHNFCPTCGRQMDNAESW